MAKHDTSYAQAMADFRGGAQIAAAPLPAAAESRAGEARISYAKRADLPDSAFALPEKRQGGKGGLPLTDERGKLDARHVSNAAARLSMMRNRGSVTPAQYRRARAAIQSAACKTGVQRTCAARLSARVPTGSNTNHRNGGLNGHRNASTVTRSTGSSGASPQHRARAARSTREGAMAAARRRDSSGRFVSGARRTAAREAPRRSAAASRNRSAGQRARAPHNVRAYTRRDPRTGRTVRVPAHHSREATEARRPRPRATATRRPAARAGNGYEARRSSPSRTTRRPHNVRSYDRRDPRTGRVVHVPSHHSREVYRTTSTRVMPVAAYAPAPAGGMEALEAYRRGQRDGRRASPRRARPRSNGNGMEARRSAPRARSAGFRARVRSRPRDAYGRFLPGAYEARARTTRRPHMVRGYTARRGGTTYRVRPHYSREEYPGQPRNRYGQFQEGRERVCQNRQRDASGRFLPGSGGARRRRVSGYTRDGVRVRSYLRAAEDGQGFALANPIPNPMTAGEAVTIVLIAGGSYIIIDMLDRYLATEPSGFTPSGTDVQVPNAASVLGAPSWARLLTQVGITVVGFGGGAWAARNARANGEEPGLGTAALIALGLGAGLHFVVQLWNTLMARAAGSHSALQTNADGTQTPANVNTTGLLWRLYSGEIMGENSQYMAQQQASAASPPGKAVPGFVYGPPEGQLGQPPVAQPAQPAQPRFQPTGRVGQPAYPTYPTATAAPGVAPAPMPVVAPPPMAPPGVAPAPMPMPPATDCGPGWEDPGRQTGNDGCGCLGMTPDQLFPE